ncbi:MAG: hypothetical protein AAF468_20655 [Pseudomonadota bacterium]
MAEKQARERANTDLNSIAEIWDELITLDKKRQGMEMLKESKALSDEKRGLLLKIDRLRELITDLEPASDVELAILNRVCAYYTYVTRGIDPDFSPASESEAWEGWHIVDRCHRSIQNYLEKKTKFEIPSFDDGFAWRLPELVRPDMAA